MIFDRTNTIMAIKNDPEMAFVVIQHDWVGFASHLADWARIKLLAGYTSHSITK
jgi:hypothetical protein